MRIRTTNIGIIDTRRPKKVRIQQKTRECIQRILDLFEPFAQKYMEENKGQVNHPSIGCWVDANEFIGPMYGEFSSHTIDKAKKALGVKTVQVKKFSDKLNKRGRPLGAGTLKWKWLYPPRTAAAAIVELNDTRSRMFEENVLKPLSQKAIDWKCQHNRAVEILRRIMIKHSYSIPSAQAMEIAEEQGSSRRSMLRAKRILHVASRRTQGEERKWLWVWPSPEVCQWLEDQFANGVIVSNDEIYHRAKKLGWDEYLIQEARMAVGGIKITRKDGKLCWYDVNIREGVYE